LHESSALNPKIKRVFRIPDGSCDSFDLIHSLVEAAEALGSQALTYHKVISIETVNGAIKSATLEDRRTGEQSHIETRYIVNAAGSWAGEIGALVGLKI
jgi:glycerol-3-phosphate dehydrogenase